jgi:hypothetical protein
MRNPPNSVLDSAIHWLVMHPRTALNVYFQTFVAGGIGMSCIYALVQLPSYDKSLANFLALAAICVMAWGLWKIFAAIKTLLIWPCNAHSSVIEEVVPKGVLVMYCLIFVEYFGCHFLPAFEWFRQLGGSSNSILASTLSFCLPALTLGCAFGFRMVVDRCKLPLTDQI